MTNFFDTALGIGLIMAAQGLLVIGFVMISLLFLVYGDRKIWAAVQMRRGPNVVGMFGLLQTVAEDVLVDGGQNIESIAPTDRKRRQSLQRLIEKAHAVGSEVDFVGDVEDPRMTQHGPP